MLIYPTTRACQATLVTKVAPAKNCGKIPYGPEFDDVEPLKDHKGELFIIQGKGKIEEEKMMDEELGPSNQKRPREARYEEDDDDSDARSYLNLNKPKQYVIMSEEEDESGELEDDKDRDLDYNPFFDEDILF